MSTATPDISLQATSSIASRTITAYDNDDHDGYPKLHQRQHRDYTVGKTLPEKELTCLGYHYL